MSRILIAALPVMGHYRVFIRVIEQLVLAGHDVLFVSNRAFPAMDQLGCPTRTLGVANAPVPTGEEKARIVADPQANLDWQKWVRVGVVKTVIDPFRAIVREFRPDVVAADAQMYAAFIAAYLEGIPWVSIARANLNPFMFRFESALAREAEQVTPSRAEMFASFGMAPEFRIWECLSPILNLSFVTEALIGERTEIPPHTVLAGPSIPPVLRGEGEDFPWQRLASDRPIVYVSFGSMNSWQPRLIRIVAEAAEPLGVQLVIPCGDLAATDHVKNLPGNPVVVAMAPQTPLLAKAAAFVSHAGAGSLMDACYYGVPMLAIPLTSDQPANAHVISQMAKIGLAIDPLKVDVANCRQALVALLAENSEIRSSLQRVTASYRERDGAKVAADAIAQAARGAGSA